MPRRTGRARVYLDHAASTPCDPAVAELMADVNAREFANAASSHASGIRAAALIERAREHLADAIGALPEEIVFTSGATESNNLVIQGVAAEAGRRGERRRKFVALGLEHPSVLAPCRRLTACGFVFVEAPLRRDGRVDLDAFDDLVGDDALLVCIQAANNEIGTIQPLREAARIAHEHGALVHSDAAQALGKTCFNVEDLGLDFASLSAHKCYGPKGVGALWVSGGPVRAPVGPLCFGGGHERGLRPGTANTAAIVGFGEAARLGVLRWQDDARRIAGLRDAFERQITGRLNGVMRNGALDHRLPGSSSLTFGGVDADALIANVPDLDLSAASACHSGTPEPSHVLRAIGLRHEEAYSTVRVGLGRNTTMAEIEYAAARLVEAASIVRSADYR